MANGSTGNVPLTSREVRSEVTSDGELRLGLTTVVVSEPGPDEVAERVQAAPVNERGLSRAADQAGG